MGVGQQEMVLGADSSKRKILLLVFIDGVMVSLALAIAAYLRFALDIFGPASANIVPYMQFSSAFILVWLVVMAAEGTYNKRNLYVGGEEYRRVFHANNLSAMIAVLIIFSMKAPVSRAWIIMTWGLGLLFLMTSRYIHRHYVHRRNRNTAASTKVLMVGANSEAADVAEQIDSSGHLGASVIGALDGTGEVDSRLTSVGHITDLEQRVKELNPDALVVVPSALGGEIKTAFQEIKKVGPAIYIAPSLRDVMESRVSIQPIGGMPLIRVEPAKIEGFAWFVKRLFDITATLMLLLVLSPLLILVSLLILAESRGSLLFRQLRVGRDGREFKIFKFRSMVTDAEDQLDALQHLNERDGHVFKIKNDPRVTRVGKFIRRWSIDELPQLFNVLGGRMSLVGPRPPLPDEVSNYDQWQRGRLGTTPGMTGYWQVSGRSDISFDEMVKLDIFYIENWSLSFDLYILAMTAKAVTSRAGAY